MTHLRKEVVVTSVPSQISSKSGLLFLSVSALLLELHDLLLLLLPLLSLVTSPLHRPVPLALVFLRGFSQSARRLDLVDFVRSFTLSSLPRVDKRLVDVNRLWALFLYDAKYKVLHGTQVQHGSVDGCMLSRCPFPPVKPRDSSGCDRLSPPATCR